MCLVFETSPDEVDCAEVSCLFCAFAVDRKAEAKAVEFPTGTKVRELLAKYRPELLSRFDAESRQSVDNPSANGKSDWFVKSFMDLIEHEASLMNAKNQDYAGDGDPLGNFNRVAAILALYPGLKLSNPAVVACVYMLKQLDCVLYGLSRDAKLGVESYEDRLRDVSVYSKLITLILENQNAQAEAGPQTKER